MAVGAKKKEYAPPGHCLFVNMYHSNVLEVLERCPIAIRFCCGLNAIRQINEEIESGPLLDLVYGDCVVSVTVAVFSMFHPEADCAG